MSLSQVVGSTMTLNSQLGAAGERGIVPGPRSLHRARRVVAAAVPPSGGRRRGDGGRSRQSDSNFNSHSRKGKNFEKKSRRKGRPEWKRSPDDSPYRDGNRDRLVGFVTLRAARTLSYYLSETSPVVYNWLNIYIAQNPIPRDGAWDDVSGDTFLRNLLKMPAEIATGNWGRNSMYSSGRGMQVDPRQIAMRIMEIRLQLSKEMTQDLETMTDENNHLMAETLMNSLSLSLENVVEHPVDKPSPESSEATLATDTPSIAIVEKPEASAPEPLITPAAEASITPPDISTEPLILPPTAENSEEKNQGTQSGEDPKTSEIKPELPEKE